MKKNILISSIISAIAVMFLIVTLTYNVDKVIAKPLGGTSASSNIIYKFGTSTTMWIGKDIPTQVSWYNERRAFFEVGNLSGATSTAQTIYCSTNSSITRYNGIPVQASSSRSFYLNDMIFTGPLYCISPTSSSTAVIIEG